MRSMEGMPHNELVQRLLASVLKMSAEHRHADLKIAASALEEMAHSFDVLELFNDRRKVSLFGSARLDHNSDSYRQAYQFSRAITEKGFMVITGGGPGIMAAGNEGAGRENSFGMGIRLPHEQGANPHIAGDEKDISFKYFFTRKLAFLRDCHAVVLCPGGYGTHDEGFETLTLMQTGKAQLLPVVCLAPNGNPFWSNWERYLKDTLLAQGMIAEHDLDLHLITHSVEEACEEIVRFYRRYHSMRFDGPDLVIRLTAPITDEELEALNVEFSDLVADGTIHRGPSPHGDSYDPRLEELPSLRFHFIHGRYGRLRKMLNVINDSPTPCPSVAPEHGEGGRLLTELDDGKSFEESSSFEDNAA